MADETMGPLRGPFEILEIGENGVKEFNVLRWEMGRMTITRRSDGVTKEIDTLRIHVPQDVKPLFPDYYDITAQTLIAQILPVLQAPGWEKKRFRVQKFGSGPTARFQVQVSPL